VTLGARIRSANGIATEDMVAMNRHILATGLLLMISVTCFAEPVPSSVELEDLIESSDSVYLCQVQRITVSPSDRPVEKARIGTYEVVCKVLASLKGTSLPEVKVSADTFSNRANPILPYLETNGVIIAFLRQSDEPDRFRWTRRWYSAMPIRKYYPRVDSDKWDTLKRVVKQLDKATQSNDPEEVRCGLYWLNMSERTASQLSDERLWRLASSEDCDVQILALKALVQSGNRKAIEQAVSLAIKISKDKSKVNRENLGSLLWHIAGRFSSKVPKDLAEELSGSSDPIIGGAGKDILKRR
jgi:hypothetical protein